MKYSFEIFDAEKDMTISFRNLSLDLLSKLSDEENIAKVLLAKYYLYGVYDKVTIVNNNFMILKSTKQNVILINL